LPLGKFYYSTRMPTSVKEDVIAMDLGLRDRVAIVTGSSQGIGKAIALGLSEEGARVSICARNEKTLGKTAREIHSTTGGQVYPIQADLTNRDDIKRLVAKTYEWFGRIDILVNNTGGPPSATFLETWENHWRDAVDLLLMSVVTACREVIPHMQERKWGRIINMTSFAAKQPAERCLSRMDTYKKGRGTGQSASESDRQGLRRNNQGLGESNSIETVGSTQRDSRLGCFLGVGTGKLHNGRRYSSRRWIHQRIDLISHNG